LAELALLSGCGAPTLPFRAPPARVPRIGALWPGAASDANFEAFRQGLQDFGYTEGQNLIADWRFAEGQADRYTPLAAELAGLPLDVIVVSPATVNAARQATTTIPIVFGPLGDPVSTGIVRSLARPGGNVTGLSVIGPQLAGKRLELLKEAFPHLTSVAAIWNPQGISSMAAETDETKVAADHLGIRFQALQARNDAEIPVAFRAATDGRVDGLVIIFSPLFTTSRRQIVELTATTGLPTISGEREFSAAGGLMAYGPNVPDLWRHAASYVDKILKGAKPADLPVEQPTTFDFVINLKTARALGLAIPPSVMQQATEVIQ
jgi:ABC-type uncharacterized transport system substrate-binding protein